MKNEIADWRNTTGLSYFNRPGEDPLKKAIDISDNIDDLNMEELDQALIVLASYHNYLSAELGKINAKLNALEDDLEMKLGYKAARMSAQSNAERRAIALERNPELQGSLQTIRRERVKQDMLKPVIDSVRLKIDAMKKVYDRRGRNVA